MEDVLADVDAENGDSVFGIARHGGLHCSWAPLDAGYCGEHRRSIPLAGPSTTYVGVNYLAGLWRELTISRAAFCRSGRCRAANSSTVNAVLIQRKLIEP